MNKQTNAQFILDLMTFSKHGALAEAFIIEAIASYSKLVLSSTSDDNTNVVITNKVWKAIAKEMEEKVTAKYGE